MNVDTKKDINDEVAAAVSEIIGSKVSSFVLALETEDSYRIMTSGTFIEKHKLSSLLRAEVLKSDMPE